MKDKKTPGSTTNYLPIYMCLGISVGTALGVAADNLALYMPIGMSIGLCIGALLDAKKRNTSGENSDDDEKSE